MRIFFTNSDRDANLKEIDKAMEGRKLKDMVEFSIEGNELVMTISKMGKTVLRFAETPKDGGLQYDLSSEKIAFAHRAFKADVTEKILEVVKQAGGKVS